MINFCFEVVTFLFLISPFLLLIDLPRPTEPGKKGLFAVAQWCSFSGAKKETETLMSLERRCVYLHQHNHFDEGSFTFILLFLQQFLIPFAASKKSSICFDLSIRRILLHRSGIKRQPCVFIQGAEAPKNEGHFSKTTFILFCLLCRGLYDHLSSFPTGAAAFFILH